MSALGRISIRARLTLLYVGLLSLVLVLYAAGASALLLRNLREQLDHRLDEDVETIEGLLALDSSGHIRLMTDNLDEDARDLWPHFLEVWSTAGSILYRSRNWERVISARRQARPEVRTPRDSDPSNSRMVPAFGSSAGPTRSVARPSDFAWGSAKNLCGTSSGRWCRCWASVYR
jgi:hypothetical protein